MLKRGTKVKVVFDGTMEKKPLELSNGTAVARVRVEGMPGWVAVVPASAVQEQEQS